MLITEWSIEDEKAASFKEGREEGHEEEREAIVKNALLKGFPFETIRDITGLDMEQITALSATM